MCRPVARHRERLKDMAVVMGKAKLVAKGVLVSWRKYDTPCVASFFSVLKKVETGDFETQINPRT